MPRKKPKETAYQYKCRIEGISEEEKKTDIIGHNPDGTFAKNNCANPNGRPPKGHTLADLARERLDKIAFIDATIADLKSKDATVRNGARKLLWNYIDGMPKEYAPLPNDDENERDAKLYRLYRKLSPIQKNVVDQLEDGIKYIVDQWGRRTGKTELNGYLPVYIAVRYPDAEITYIHLTAKNAVEQAAHQVKKVMDEIGHKAEFNASKGYIEHGQGGKVHFVGNESKDDREKMLGFGKNRRLVLIDECQSQKELKYVLNEKIMATLMDCAAALVLSGTKSRVRGTHWEQIYTTPQEGKRINFANMFQNPFLPDPKGTLDRILKERGLSINDAFVRREFFNEDAYDDEALVYKVSDHNYYTDAMLKKWIEEYGATVHAVCGLDLGYEDADAVSTILYSTRDDKLWLIHEKAVRRQSIDDTVSMAKEALEIAAKYTVGKVYIMADMGGLGKKIGEDMFYKYGLPIMPAEKSSKEAASEVMQSDIRAGRMMILKSGIFDADCMKVVYKRDDQDRLTRIVDDNIHHSDIIDAVLYPHREASKHVRR